MKFTKKTNKIIFYIVNLLFVVPYIVKNYSSIGVGVAIALLLFLLFQMLKKEEENLPASVYLPFIVWIDFFIYIGINHQILKDTFDWDRVTNFFISSNDTCFWMLGVGVALLFIGISKVKYSWLFGCGATFVGSSVILTLWSNCQLDNIVFVPWGESVLAIFLLVTIIWSIVYQISIIVSPYKRILYIWLGLSLLLSILILNVANYDYLLRIGSEIELLLLNLPTTYFAWWKVILVTVIAIIGAIEMYPMGNKEVGVDGLVVFALGDLIFSIKLLMSNYFSYNWILFFVLLGCILVCINNESNAQKMTLNFSNSDYLIILSIVFIICVLLLKNGLWINLIISTAFLLLFYSKKKVFEKNSYHNIFFYLYIIACVLCEAMGWMWKFRSYTNGFIMLGIIFVVTLLGVFIINMNHPNGICVRRSVCLIICVCMLILSLLCMNKYGTKVDISFQSEENTLEIVLKARGKNEVESAYYYWSNKNGDSLQEQNVLYEGTQTIPIEGELLTIVVVDSKGITTTVNEWYPEWLLKR